MESDYITCTTLRSFLNETLTTFSIYVELVFICIIIIIIIIDCNFKLMAINSICVYANFSD
jgi:hypothetical protein